MCPYIIKNIDKEKKVLETGVKYINCYIVGMSVSSNLLILSVLYVVQTYMLHYFFIR